MTVRALLAAALAPLATPAYGYRLVPYARDLDVTETPVVMLRLDDVKPGADGLARAYTYTLVLVTPLTDPTGPADDDLDLVLEDVIHVIELASDGIVWTAAKRGVYAERHPAYEVAITVYTTHGR